MFLKNLPEFHVQILALKLVFAFTVSFAGAIHADSDNKITCQNEKNYFLPASFWQVQSADPLNQRGEHRNGGIPKSWN
jgi:hypothetical protein